MSKDWLWQKITHFTGVSGKAVFSVSSRFTAKPMQYQQKLVSSLMRKNAMTEYGKKFHFADIHSIEDYQRNIPLSTYADFEPYIARMLQGENNLITHKKIKRFVTTSGSAGKSKMIPLCGQALWNLHLICFCAPMGAALNFFKGQGRDIPAQHSFMMVEVINKKLPNGKSASCLSSLPVTLLKPFSRFFACSPREVLFPEHAEEMDMNYFKLRFALPRRDITALAGALVTYMENIFEYLESNWELLVNDIAKGTIDSSVRCPASVREKLERKLRPDPVRAAELRSVFEKGFDIPVCPQIWPELEWTAAMRNGSLATYAKKLERYCGSLPFHDTGYVASEAVMAMPLAMNDMDGVLLPKNCFFEFLPVGCEENTLPLTMDKLEEGKEYEVIITNLAGLYRYRMFDVIRVTGFYQKTPKVEFIYRSNLVLNSTGEKTTQQMLDWAMEKTFADLKIKPCMYCTAIAKTDDGIPYYDFFIEQDGQEPFTDAFVESLDRNLCESNLYIASRRRQNILAVPKVHRLPVGTFAEYRQCKQNKGTGMNQLKPVTVLHTEELRSFFYSEAEKCDGCY